MSMYTSRAASQKDGEAEIPVHEEWASALVEHSVDAFVLSHTPDSIFYASSAIEQTTGYSPQEFIVLDPLSIIHPDDLEGVRRELNDLYGTAGGSVRLHYRLKHKNGSWRWIEATYKNLQHDPRIEAVAGYLHDNTENHYQLASSETRLHVLNDISTLLVSSLDHQITLQEIAHLLVPTLADYCRIALLDEQQQIRDITVNHIDPEKIKLVQALYEQYKDKASSTHGLQKLLQTGEPELIATVSGSVLAAVQDNPELLTLMDTLGLQSYMGVPLIARGKTIGAITFSSIQPHRHYTHDDLLFVQEIARRIALTLDHARLYQKAREELEEREQRESQLRFLAEASSILASSLDYETTLANVAQLAVPYHADWCSVVMNSEQGIQQLAVAHVDPEKVQWARELNQNNPPDPQSNYGLPKVLRTGKAELYPTISDDVLVAAARNEEELHLMRTIGFTSSMVAPLLLQGKAIGAITFVSAESGRHYNSTDLSMAEELASRAVLAIENARLYTEAQKAIHLRDEFIATASHELRTPITSLKMYTQVLQKQLTRQGEERLVNSLVKMDAQITKLTRLIGDLLSVSRLELGKLAFREEMFDLNEVITETVEQVQATSNQTIHIKGCITSHVWGDKERIGQVMTNLLTNAVKYSPQAQTIIVHAINDQEHATVTVQDFGIGIAGMHQQHIFERFYRVNDPEERTYPGLGIGLHIAHEIITRHGGTMDVVSEKGQGSQFSFTLPYTPPDHS